MITVFASIYHNPKTISWYYEDMAKGFQLSLDAFYFRVYTLNKKIIMDYDTFKNIGPMDDREIYVITNRPSSQIDYIRGDDNVHFVDSINFSQIAQSPDEYVICGCDLMYHIILQFTSKLELIWHEVVTDAHVFGKVFPNIKQYGNWKIVDCHNDNYYSNSVLYRHLPIEYLAITRYQRVS